MAAPLKDPLEAAIMRGFAPFLSERASASKRVIRASLPFARQTGGGDGPAGLLVDREALFSGMIADGLKVANRGTSSLWLVETLRSRGIEPEGLLRERPYDAHYALSGEIEVAPSDSVRMRILPFARECGRATSGNEDFHLRHLCFALLDDLVRNAWDRAPLEQDAFKSLRDAFLERVFEDYPREAEAWRLVAGQPVTDRPGEGVRTLSDAPATVDALGREAFAQVLAQRIKQVRAELEDNRAGGDAAFIIHMDGPWGSGKSTILNFLRAKLEAEGPPWLVVQFNAWRHQGRKPAWWPLVLEVRAAAVRRPALASPAKWLPWLWWRWLLAGAVYLWWRLRMDWLSYVFAFACLAAAAYLVWGASPRDWLEMTERTSDTIKAVGAILVTAASMLAMGRGFTLGSSRNAEAYLECKSEPFLRVLRLFGLLVRAAGRPMAVFIDDLDRCGGDYVIDLIEGVQTSLRGEPVVFLVSGDRKWICSSFEKRYADFRGDIGTPGRPLGYLFLDKVFQVSTAIPIIPAERQIKYWRQLLERGAKDNKAIEEERSNAAKRAATLLAGATDEEQTRAAIAASAPDSLDREALQAEAAVRTTSREATEAAEHRLQPLAPLLERNPRAMKRLVNAYGLNRAVAYLEGRSVGMEPLARWTIVELRWPRLAEFIAANWRSLEEAQAEDPGSFDADRFAEIAPADLKELLKSGDVRRVFGKPADEGRLSFARLREILD